MHFHNIEITVILTAANVRIHTDHIDKRQSRPVPPAHCSPFLYKCIHHFHHTTVCAQLKLSDPCRFFFSIWSFETEMFMCLPDFRDACFCPDIQVSSSFPILHCLLHTSQVDEFPNERIMSFSRKMWENHVVFPERCDVRSDLLPHSTRLTLQTN